MRLLYRLFLALLLAGLCAPVVLTAPAPLPRRDVLPPFCQRSLIGTWQVRWDDCDCLMTFDSDGSYGEQMTNAMGRHRSFEGLWTWRDGCVLVVCHSADGHSPVHAHRFLLGADWRGKDLRHGCRVAFVRKLK